MPLLNSRSLRQSADEGAVRLAEVHLDTVAFHLRLFAASAELKPVAWRRVDVIADALAGRALTDTRTDTPIARWTLPVSSTAFNKTVGAIGLASAHAHLVLAQHAIDAALRTRVTRAAATDSLIRLHNQAGRTGLRMERPFEAALRKEYPDISAKFLGGWIGFDSGDAYKWLRMLGEVK